MLVGSTARRSMRIIALKTLLDFCKGNPANTDAEGPLRAWYHEVKKAKWSDPAEIKAKYGSASILKGNRVVFNIGGNKYRLVVKINYAAKVVYIRFIGTHSQYDQIDAEAI